jgi:hypothetical protein
VPYIRGMNNMATPTLRADVRRNSEGRIELRFYMNTAENVTAIILCSPAIAADLAQQIVDNLQPIAESEPGETIAGKDDDAEA